MVTYATCGFVFLLKVAGFVHLLGLFPIFCIFCLYDGPFVTEMMILLKIVT